MNIADDINQRVAALSEDQRAQLQHLFLHLVFVIENPRLQGFFIHTLPSPAEADIEPVLGHSINADLNAVEEMLCNFLAVRAAMAADEAGVDPTRSH